MYNTQDISNRIKARLKSKNVNTKKMLSDLDMGINAISEFAKGKQMSCISLAKIADYLDCSVDYLLDREQSNNPRVTYNSANPQIYKIIKILETGNVSDSVIEFIYKALEAYDQQETVTRNSQPLPQEELAAFNGKVSKTPQPKIIPEITPPQRKSNR